VLDQLNFTLNSGPHAIDPMAYDEVEVGPSIFKSRLKIGLILILT